jgi:hypothetical protein
MLTSHPASTRYYGSRDAAAEACGRGEKVVRLGRFAAGSFGVYPRLRSNGQPVGIPTTGVTVWAVMPK